MAGFVFYKRIMARISAFSAPARDFSRFEAPVPAELPLFAQSLPEMDTVGAWAAEREAMGLPVDDDELEVQRWMWAAEAAN